MAYIAKHRGSGQCQDSFVLRNLESDSMVWCSSDVLSSLFPSTEERIRSFEAMAEKNADLTFRICPKTVLKVAMRSCVSLDNHGRHTSILMDMRRSYWIKTTLEFNRMSLFLLEFK
jgi:hypothetical protein